MINRCNKKFNIVVFIFESLTEYDVWEQVLSFSVVQSKNINDDYSFAEKLGEGSYGCVYLGNSKRLTQQSEESK